MRIFDGCCQRKNLSVETGILNFWDMFLIVIFILLNNNNILYCRDEKPLFWFGGYAAYNLNLYFANFQSLEGINDCCPEYIDGIGGGFSIGGLFEYPLKDDLGLNIRLGYSGLSGQLEENESIGYQTVYDNISKQNRIAQVKVLDVIVANIKTVGLETTISFNFFHSFYMDAGIQLTYMFDGKVDHYEKLIEPDNVVFLDGRLVQNDIYNVELPDKKSLLINGIFGIGYQLPISEKTVIVPEIRYYMPFMDVTSRDWKIASLHFGASLKIPVMEPVKLPEIDKTIYQRDTSLIAIIGLDKEEFKLVNEKVERFSDTTDEAIFNYTKIIEHYEKKIPKEGKLEASFEIIGLTKEGKRQAKPEIVIEELETEEGFPLLPHIFFNEGSADLNKSGLKLKTKEQFQLSSPISNLPWNVIGIYDELLNIVAERMIKEPGIKLIITGCNNNRGIEANNLELSSKRAQAVKDYLVNICGIEQNRIITQSRNLPDNPGNILVADGIAENQRVELSSNDINLLKPVILKEIVKTSNPPYILIRPRIVSEAGLKQWKIVIKQEENTLREFSGTSIDDDLRWTVGEQPLPNLDKKVNIFLEAIDRIGKSVTFSDSVQLQQLTIKKKRYELKGDKRVERFSLILFDYDKADINPAQLAILNEIKSRIKDNSNVTIAGYADRTGESGYNRELARRRIQEVQKILNVPRWNLKTEPVGSDIILYDNNLPQGRGYSRTVQITVETPIENH